MGGGGGCAGLQIRKGTEDNSKIIFLISQLIWLVGWLVGCFVLNSPLRQYFCLYRAVSQREGERKEKR